MMEKYSYHMQGRILLLCCQLADTGRFYCTMSFVAAETEGRRRLISKSFHHQLKYHEKQPLVGEWVGMGL